MEKKVIIISGSARKGGNSDLLCDEFLKGAAEAGNEVEKIRLAEKKIAGCIGCMACKKNDGVCVFKDDLPGIVEKVIDADVMVMASPVYYYAVNSQTKAFIDRTFARLPDIRDKEVYFILTCTDDEHAVNEALHDLRSFVHFLPGAVEKGVVYGTGNREKGAVIGKPVMQEAYEMGKTI
ncbi:MAG: flavodoxin family protein [Lachnospiraceae bacterium]|nr:flavodoxin family protein [Lachnospiraceae bacterium]